MFIIFYIYCAHLYQYFIDFLSKTSSSFFKDMSGRAGGKAKPLKQPKKGEKVLTEVTFFNFSKIKKSFLGGH